jgi:AcrR family transcriptional regulator
MPRSTERAERSERTERPERTERTYGGVSASERTAARRARFIEAGIALFGSSGLRGATVRGVCLAAGLTDRYFYESFDSLEALLQACYGALMARLDERMDQARHAATAASAGLAPLRQLECHVTAGYEAWFDLVREPSFARIVLAEVLGVSPAVDALYEAGMQRFSELNSAALAAALPPGRLSAERQALVGRALIGAAVQVASLWRSQGYRTPRDEVVRTCVLVTLGTLQALSADGLPGAADLGRAEAAPITAPITAPTAAT